MKFSIHIDQIHAIEFGLNISEAAVYSWFVENKICVDYNQIAIDLPWIASKSDTIYRACFALEKKGILRNVVQSDVRAMQALDNGFKVGCIACGRLNPIHKHHYPIRQKDGGTDTVNFCANHHFDFHKMVDYGFFTLNEL